MDKASLQSQCSERWKVFSKTTATDLGCGPRPAPVKLTSSLSDLQAPDNPSPIWHPEYYRGLEKISRVQHAFFWLGELPMPSWSLCVTWMLRCPWKVVMGASLAVVAGPVGRGLDGKRRVESEAAVSCAGGAPRGQGKVC